MNREEMTFAKDGRCKGCDFCRGVSGGGFDFLGCYHKPYKGKWVCEIKKCPKQDIGEHCCFACGNSFVDEADELHCMADGHDHEAIVADDHTCDDWN